MSNVSSTAQISISFKTNFGQLLDLSLAFRPVFSVLTGDDYDSHAFRRQIWLIQICLFSFLKLCHSFQMLK